LREVFLKELLTNLVSRYPNWKVEDHSKIEWKGQPRDIWPEADIVISMPGRRFIVEYNEDGDPGRSLIKYWPVLEDLVEGSLTIIEVCKNGQTIGQGYSTLATWLGEKMMELYPGTIYKYIERTNEPSDYICEKIAQVIFGIGPFSNI